VSLTILSFLGASISKKFKNFPKTELNIPILIFFTSLCLSVIFALDFKPAVTTLFKKNLEWFLLFFVVIATLNSKKRIKVFLGILLFSAFVVALDGIYQQKTGSDLFRNHLFNNKMTASFNHQNDYAGYLGVLLPLSICLSFYKKKSFKVFFGFFSILLGYCLVMTASRGGWMSVFLALIFLVFFSLFKTKNKKSVVASFLILVLLLSLFSFFSSAILPEHTQYPWSTTLQRLDSGRRFMWGVTSLMIKENNPLFGMGLGSFMTVYLPYREKYTGIPEPKIIGYAYKPPVPIYAHNCYLQLTAETGIFGLLSFLAIIILFFKKTITTFNKNKDFLLLGLISGILAYLIHAGIDTHLYSMQLSDFFWIMLGLVIAIIKIGPIETKGQLQK